MSRVEIFFCRDRGGEAVTGWRRDTPDNHSPDLARVSPASEVQADGMLALEVQDRGVHTLALRWGIGLVFLDQGKDACTGAVLIASPE